MRKLFKLFGREKTFLRKIRKIFNDPILRRWAIKCLWTAQQPHSYTPHSPNYLKKFLPLSPEIPDWTLPSVPIKAKPFSIIIQLAGQQVEINSAKVDQLFERSFEDPETFLSLHRFSWLSNFGDKIDPFWVHRIWKVWQENFIYSKNHWVWHPYTVAERAVNILNFSRKYGFPGEPQKTLETLVAHALSISKNLEYFGDHNTSNHLANNGRGLFFLGLFLKMPNCANLGGEILLSEADRIFLRSGILREGSTHYHALLTRNYAEVYQVAKLFKRKETAKLKIIVEKGLSSIRCLTLPGGVPLFGDISPDRSPESVFRDINEISDKKIRINIDDLKNDGWWRFERFNWSSLWHVPPRGWCHYPGHGHQDCGSFELHYLDMPLFIDPGRGEYGDSQKAMFYHSGAAHNLLVIDNCDPYPANKPYYSDTFRDKIISPQPKFTLKDNVAKFIHSGYSRVKKVGLATRIWSFQKNLLAISDTVEGGGRHLVSRNFCTTLNVKKFNGSLILSNKKYSFKFSFEKSCQLSLEKGISWAAYGEGAPATFIRISYYGMLPWSGKIMVEKI